MYDLIGDIHGYATPLKYLLTKLGYSERDGVWQHPERQVAFLGDFVDRGPEQVETVRIARAMVEAGLALAVMGNHEFNAVAWATENPEASGQYLRAHSEKHRSQHQAYLDQVEEGSALHHEHIAWFKTLPLSLDLGGLRVIHACWHPPSLRVLSDYMDAQQRIREMPGQRYAARAPSPTTRWKPRSRGWRSPYHPVTSFMTRTVTPVMTFVPSGGNWNA